MKFEELNCEEKLKELFERAESMEDGSDEQQKIYKEAETVWKIFAENEKINNDFINEQRRLDMEAGKIAKQSIDEDKWGKRILKALTSEKVISSLLLVGVVGLEIGIERKGVLTPKQLTPVINKII